MLFAKKVFVPVYDYTGSDSGLYNRNLVPELWANESLAILEENMVMANLVNRDFDEQVAEYGEIVHTRRPAEFEATRKGNSDDVTTQGTSTTGVNVALNQWVHVSFIIKDGEQSKSFKDLVALYLQPAMLANARFLDQVVAAQAVQFLGNCKGGLEQMSSSNAKDYLVDMHGMFNANKAYEQGRNLVLATQSEAAALKADLFIKANEVGDGGNAMTNAKLGRKFGFDSFVDMNVPSCTAGAYTAGTTEAAALKGASTIYLSAPVVYGQYFTVAGDYSPLRAATVSATTTDDIVVTTRPTIGAIASGAVTRAYTTGLIDTAGDTRTNSSGVTIASATIYPVGWDKSIQVNGSGVPHVGQIVSFNDTSGGVIRTAEYVIIQTNGSTLITLDRPLEVALDNDDVVNYGPNGDYNFAFHKNALSLVNRPLALPMAGLAKAAVANYNGMSMRVVITYDGAKQGHRVTLDSLFGTAVLDTDLGGVLLG